MYLVFIALDNMICIQANKGELSILFWKLHGKTLHTLAVVGSNKSIR